MPTRFQFAEDDNMSKPKIAIPGRKGATVNYVHAMKQLGAESVLVGADCDPRDFDGLLMPGGVDIHPDRYGQENTACLGIDEALDEIQFACLDAFVKAGKPVLGICRGHQLINVYFGGTLIQHIPTAKDHVQLEDDYDQAHMAIADEDCFLAGIYGTHFPVNSSHHQAVDVPGKGLKIVQRAEDGTVEAMQHETLNVISVQWHPERMCYNFARPDTVDGSKLLAYWVGQLG